MERETRSGIEQLREWARRNGGVSSAEAAAKLGIHRTTLYKILQGKQRPSLAMAKKLADATGIGRSKFLVWD